MNWNDLQSTDQLNNIDQESHTQAILIFKHSTRCNISAMALSRMERNWEATVTARLKPYYLDLIRYRDISNEIATRYGVEHESPQVLLIEQGRCTYSATHSEIAYAEILSKI